MLLTSKTEIRSTVLETKTEPSKTIHTRLAGLGTHFTVCISEDTTPLITVGAQVSGRDQARVPAPWQVGFTVNE